MDEVFFERFSEWKKVMQNCPCRKSSHPVDYCLYEGIPCNFVKCPRRIYEERLREQPPVLLEEKISQLEQRIDELHKSITQLQVRINQLAESFIHAKSSGSIPQHSG